QDRTGFLWIGTREGLIRYDGYTATTFRHDASDPHSLSENAIRVIAEDGTGLLWVGTNGGGLERFAPATGRVRHLPHAGGAPRSLSNDGVYSLAEDGRGGLWVGTLSGLDHLDPATGRCERFLPGSYVDVVRADRRGALWIGMVAPAGTVTSGLHRRDPETG